MRGHEKGQPLSPTDVIAAIQRIVEEGDVIPSIHIKQRMRARNFSMEDVFQVLETGRLWKPPQWNATYKNWEYDIEGRDIEGDPLTIRVAIDDDELTLITGF
jgi:Domain of unknown function (DUF4258)